MAQLSYLEALTARGIGILGGRTLSTDESSFGIVIFRAESEEAARAIMTNDPAVQAGVTPWPDRQGRLAPALRPALGGLHRPCRPSRTSAGVRARLFPYRIALMADREAADAKED